MYKTVSMASLLAGLFAGPGLAETEVRWLHLEGDGPVVEFMEELEAGFEAKNPGVDVKMQFLGPEAFKARLTTMLQSDDRPHLFYTWAGGVMRAQADAGFLKDITADVEGAWKDSFSPGALSAYEYNGAYYGVPQEINQVGFWYNRRLFDEAGVDPESIKTWDDLLAAVARFKEAGITPIATGGADKWPLHFYWTHLAGRIGGKEAFDAALAGEGDGFAAAPFVAAGERFVELVTLEPFQDGFLAAGHSDAAGVFGDGQAAMQLQGSWNRFSQVSNSANGKGLPEDELAWMPFPMVEGGAGNATDTLGGINGWLVGAGAPQEAVDFLRFITSPENQREAAARGLHVPPMKGMSDVIEDPFSKQFAEKLAASTYHQIFWDQDLGPSVGRVVNDVSTELAAGSTTPEQAAQTIQDAWSFENM
ncbi:ABC transporter substrate-binding protein [Oceaniglobus trochenteri]|uniref:ABC transporter substrate-binding protein n=1 Tax=Oceaniglobus trochenteri TaxID=2763260 RepID=UPI001CFF94AD|nr:extracellular solute-binding protein [Oceaniglobus trochenteri]